MLRFKEPMKEASLRDRLKGRALQETLDQEARLLGQITGKTGPAGPGAT